MYAENADAIIRRGYYRNGAVRGDTLLLRNYENVTTAWRLSDDGRTLNFVSAVPAR